MKLEDIDQAKRLKHHLEQVERAINNSSLERDDFSLSCPIGTTTGLGQSTFAKLHIPLDPIVGLRILEEERTRLRTALTAIGVLL